MEFPLSLKDRITNWLGVENPPKVQVAFPDLDSNQREFLLTGVTKEEWDEIMAFPECPICGDPIDYCPGHGYLPKGDI